MELNTTTVEMINSFAKANKVSKAKLTEFVAELAGQFATKKAVRTGGRKTSEKYLRVQSELRQMKNFTVNDVATKFGIPYLSARSVVSKFVRAGALVQAGVSETKARGKKAVVWTSQ